MHHFQNLLYVSHGTNEETAGLKQALSLARNNNAALEVLVIAPEFPQDFPDHKKKFEESLIAQAQSSIDSTRDALKLEEPVNISIQLLVNQKPAIKIIQHAIQQDYDLIIKEAEPQDNKSGFKALDMELLRKSPMPLWLCRPIKHHRQDIQVAVAIDPINDEPVSVSLSEDLLELSRSLADSCSGELQIISCWDYPLETELKNNVFIKIPDDQIVQKVEKARQNHLLQVERLVEKSGITGTNSIHHIRGKADLKIPEFVNKQRIDILVMGTVARTGIPGLIFGNTAENIIQNLPCSLLALKPKGFVSPVSTK